MKARDFATLGAVFLSITACAACTKSDASRGSGEGGVTTTTSASSDRTLDAINAKVPEELAGILHFEVVTFRGDANGDGRVDLNEKVSAYKPAGWNPPQGFEDRFDAPKNAKADASFSEQYTPTSTFDLGTDCDGACVPKDWKKIAEKKGADSFGKKAVTKEEELPHGGHIRWGTWQEDDFDHTSYGAVVATWPVEGASVLRSCEATITDPRLLPALDAFADACKASQKF